MNEISNQKTIEKLLQKIKLLEEKIEELSNFKEDIESILVPLKSLIFLIDENGNYLKISPTCPDNLLLLPREQMEGKNIRDFFPIGRVNFFLNYINEAIKNEKSISIEYMLPIQGKNVWFESRAIPILEEKGKPKRVVSIIRDITKWRT